MGSDVIIRSTSACMGLRSKDYQNSQRRRRVPGNGAPTEQALAHRRSRDGTTTEARHQSQRASHNGPYAGHGEHFSLSLIDDRRALATTIRQEEDGSTAAGEGERECEYKVEGLFQCCVRSLTTMRRCFWRACRSSCHRLTEHNASYFFPRLSLDA